MDMRVRAATFAAAVCICAPAHPEQRQIDTAQSEITVRVYKAGVLGALGHDHEIAAAVESGAVDVSAHAVELRVAARSLKVRDANASEKDRGEIQATMTGPEVLDIEQYPEIIFRSTGSESAGDGVWRLRGNLTIHGQARLIDVDVRESGGRYRGGARIKQSEFGIKPVKVAGGAIRVKDEIRIEFDIQLTR
jgi:polyisoprenoid-binding protein YceI